ncbi:MAG: S-layer homology domain-containing protein [Clostridia bacterium]|nr:S-layer homology domain-containing protein [Clostridia bacterium]
MAYGNGTYVAVGALETILTSTDDGDTWTLRHEAQGTPANTGYLQSVAFGNGKFVAVGYNNTILVSADDGLTWTTVSSYSNPVYSGHFESVIFVDGRFVMAGTSGQVLTSEDGETWSPVAGTGFWVNGMATDGHGRLVLVGNGIAITSSKLAALTVSPGTLSPAFDPDVTDYVVYLPSATDVDVTATLDDPLTSMTIDGTPQANGVARTISLHPGVTTIPITVTSEVGTTKTYTITFRVADGSGTLTTATSSVIAGTDGNSLTFTYTAQTAMNDGAVAIDVPAGWSPPSTNAEDPGFTTASDGTLSVAGNTITVAGLTLSAGETVTITYGDRSGGGPGATAPTTAGPQTWQARSKASTSGALTDLAVSPVVAVESGASYRLEFAAQPGGGTGATAWSSQPAVVVQDVYGNTVTTAALVVTLTITDGTGTAGAALTCDANPVQTVNGVATFSGCRIDEAGTGYRLTATAGLLTNADSDPFDITVGPAATFTVTPAVQQTTAGEPVDVIVTAKDAGGNVVTGYTGTVLVVSTDPALGSSDEAGNPLWIYTFQTSDQGQKTFRITFGTAGTQTVTFFAGPVNNPTVTGTSDPVTVEPGPPYRLQFVGQPGGGTGGVAWMSRPSVAVKDRFGNIVTTATDAIALGILVDTGTEGATLACDGNPVQAVDGVATFSGCRIDKAGTGYQLIARSGSLILDHSEAFDIAVGPAATFVVTPAVQQATAGEPVQVAVTVTDAGGNTVTNYAGTVRFSSSDGQAVLPADLTFTGTESGQSTFTVEFRTSGNQTVTVTDSVDAAVTGTSSTVAVLPAEPHNVVVTASPTVVIVHGTATVTARVRDAYGNDVADGTPVTFAVTDGTATLSRTSGTTSGGTVSVEVSSSEIGTATVAATVDQTSIGGSASITFVSAPENEVPSITASGAIDPAQGGVVSDPNGLVRLEIPAGAIESPSPGSVMISVTIVPGPEAAKMLEGIAAPPGVAALDVVLVLKAVAPDGTPIEHFAEPLTLALSPSVFAPAGASDPERLGLFKIGDDGTLVFAGGRLVDGELVVELRGFSQYVLAEVSVSFADMEGHWARDDVELLASKYVVLGLPDGRFDPEGRITRAQFVAMLVRVMDIVGVPSSVEAADGLAFPDVPPTAWFAHELAVAVEEGLVTGFADGTFRPDEPITREQVAVMVERALARTGTSTALTEDEVSALLAAFGDGQDVSAWARDGMALAVAEGIVGGRAPGVLAPQAEASRAEAATMIARFWRR